MFEIGRVLAARGHTAEFAIFEGQGSWTKGYGFVKKIYLLGPEPMEEQLNARLPTNESPGYFQQNQMDHTVEIPV